MGTNQWRDPSSGGVPMIAGVIDVGLSARPVFEGEQHVLVVAPQPNPRYAVASLLLDAGLRVTLAATFGVVEVLLGASETFDLMVIAQSSEETTLFGVPQLARSIDADLPILVMEYETTDSPAVVDMVRQALMRWPIRERIAPALH